MQWTINKKTYSNFLQKVTIFSEYLHARSFVATVTDNKFPSSANHCNFTWIP